MADNLIRIQLDGGKEVTAAFRAAPARMSKMLTIVLKTAAFMIQATSMKNTPVLTGRLRASHYVRFKPLTAEVGASANYALFVHEGTRFMPGRPFLRDSMEYHHQDVLDLFTRGTQEVLNEIGNAS